MIRKVGEHAIVLGAGISGLLAARVLTDFYGRVTLVERDALGVGLPRKGVPQGFHAHALLPRGLQILEELFPGLTGELVAGGAMPYEMIVQLRMIMGGHEFARMPTGEKGVSATRPFLESHVLRRVRDLPGLVTADRSQVTGILTGEGAVTGARIADEDGERELPADLVVDAMGRGGRTLAWLESMGLDRPEEETVKVEVAYATWYLRLAEGTLGEDRMVLVGTYRGQPKGAALCAVEGDRWLVTLGGSAGVRPPTDPEGFFGWIDEVAPADVAAAVRAAEPLGEIGTARIPTSVRRRYERLSRFPEGLLVTGDAICNFNPIYGQGMSVGALDALALRDCLREGTRDLAHRYFAAVARALDPAWQLSTGADLALREAEGARPLQVRVLNAYIRRLQRVAARDPRVAVAFSRVSGLLDPPSALMRPAVVWRAVRG
ncbi:FAD-dependent oxidoreductase [Streptosporangium sp. NBC_01756]|uniref:FAD-dependent oxidoreductase n=1 Tax=Streptosporangium sp. NBC_01756 TaxID=2975950 RepID=UPI002DD84A9A|nr:FAD-dependent monooxygenase [Streptosporangium sp. NBC_01756]WSC88237.1 FAD-dependent monooxygenase [Streptosporangium sp. NBC_01756]